jgi:hypothetical protein
MRRKITQILFVLIAILGIAITFQPALAQSGEAEHYFTETGHWVRGEFWQFYQQAENAKTLYGFPITDAFTDEFGNTVQYFQRARFEQRPGSPVTLSPLGNHTYLPGSLIAINPVSPACRQDAGWAHPVCFAFLEYFDANGGEALFGKPISPLELHGEERVMQYFENVRLEWHPENPSGLQVRPGDLGYIYFRLVNEDPERLRTQTPPRGITLQVLKLRAYAFTEQAVVPNNGQQTVFVTVFDQNMEPVPGAQVFASLAYQSGKTENLPRVITSEKGFAAIQFSASGQPRDTVTVTVTVNYLQVSASTQTSFRIWY